MLDETDNATGTGTDFGTELAALANGSNLSGILKVVPGSYVNWDAVQKLIKYIASHPIPNGCNGIGCSANPEEAIKDFHRIKSIYDKMDGKQAKHIVVSFHPSGLITEEAIPWIAWHIAVYFYHLSFQVFYGIHQKTGENGSIYYHIHFAVNTVNFTNGLRLDWNWDDKKQFIQYINSLPYGIFIQAADSYY